MILLYITNKGVVASYLYSPILHPQPLSAASFLGRPQKYRIVLWVTVILETAKNELVEVVFSYKK